MVRKCHTVGGPQALRMLLSFLQYTGLLLSAFFIAAVCAVLTHGVAAWTAIPKHIPAAQQQAQQDAGKQVRMTVPPWIGASVTGCTELPLSSWCTGQARYLRQS
jgi:hypothetical protein